MMAAKRSLVELIDVAAERHGGASGRRLAEIAREAGHDITHATLNRIRQDSYLSRPSVASVRAIAFLANVSEDTAFSAAGMAAPRAGVPYSPPPEADRMDVRQRKAVTELLRAFAPAEQDTPHPFAGVDVARLAAGRDRLRIALLDTAGDAAAGGAELEAAAVEMVMRLDEALGTAGDIGSDSMWSEYLASREIEPAVGVWDR